jgi:hypothetical protein
LGASALLELFILADGHVASGHQTLLRLRELIFELECSGRDATARQARSLVGILEELQAQHVIHRDRLRVVLDAAS